MKKDKIIFWAATIVIALIEGVMPALTSQTKQGNPVPDQGVVYQAGCVSTK